MPRATIHLAGDVRTQPALRETGEPEPFRIAVFGDFTGRGDGPSEPVLIDRDNFDDVMARLRPAVDLGDGSPITFSSLDDFHPDSLLRRVRLFDRLKALHHRLADPRSFAAAASELGLAPGSPAPAAAPKRAPLNLLDQMLEGLPDPVVQPETPADEFQQVIDRIVAPYKVERADPRQDELVRRASQAIAESMRALLHAPGFQAIEGAWRGLYFLVRRLETGPDLKVYLFDVPKEKLAGDLNGAGDLRETQFYRHVMAAPQSGTWAVLAGNYWFDSSPDDVELLARIAMIAQQAGAPFLTAAIPSVVGCAEMTGMPDPREWQPDPAGTQFWASLRELPEAPYLGILTPGFLLRMPYGENGITVEDFQFEEQDGRPCHQSYLWGNPAFAAACLLGQTFAEDGWSMRPGARREFGGMPVPVFRVDGEPELQPCVEAWLTDRAAEAILEHGIMPLVASRDGDRMLLFRFQSAAHPPTALAGRW